MEYKMTKDQSPINHDNSSPNHASQEGVMQGIADVAKNNKGAVVTTVAAAAMTGFVGYKAEKQNDAFERIVNPSGVAQKEKVERQELQRAQEQRNLENGLTVDGKIIIDRISDESQTSLGQRVADQVSEKHGLELRYNDPSKQK